MIKPFSLLLLSVVLASGVPGVRAEDDAEASEEAAVQEEVAPKHEAAAAARDKGYRAEESQKAVAGSDDSAAPIMRPVPGGSFALPQARALGDPARASTRPASSAGGGTASGVGIACGKSVPKLTNIVKKEIDFIRVVEGPVVNWDVAPNEAISYHFKTPGAGTGTIFITMGHIGRPVSHLATLSQTSCDFDVDKAGKTQAGKATGQDYCYAWGASEGGLMFHIASEKTKGWKKGCVLKPNADYYFNIRSLSNPAQGEARDACADEIPFFNSRPALSRLCGGIWQLRWTPQ